MGDLCVRCANSGRPLYERILVVLNLYADWRFRNWRYSCSDIRDFFTNWSVDLAFLLAYVKQMYGFFSSFPPLDSFYATFLMFCSLTSPFNLIFFPYFFTHLNFLFKLVVCKLFCKRFVVKIRKFFKWKCSDLIGITQFIFSTAFLFSIHFFYLELNFMFLLSCNWTFTKIDIEHTCFIQLCIF